MADLNSFSATDAQHFFDEYYIPPNMVVAVVGDIKASEALPMIEKYFGRIPSRSQPDERTTTEPPQNAERRVISRSIEGPIHTTTYPALRARALRVAQRLEKDGIKLGVERHE